MMQIKELKDFFGLPTQNEEFDRYLSARGITERPVFTESPVESINWKAGGLSLVFKKESVYRRSHGEPRMRGEMIFAYVQAYGNVNNSGFSEFQGELPFNINFHITLAQAKLILGEPDSDHSSGPNWVYVWNNHHGYLIGLGFLPSDKGLSFFDIEQKKIKRPS